MPTGDAPRRRSTIPLPAPDFSGWGDEDGKKKEGQEREGRRTRHGRIVGQAEQSSARCSSRLPRKGQGRIEARAGIVFVPSRRRGTEPWPSRAGQNLIGGLNRTFDRLLTSDASLSKW